MKGLDLRGGVPFPPAQILDEPCRLFVDSGTLYYYSEPDGSVSYLPARDRQPKGKEVKVPELEEILRIKQEAEPELLKLAGVTGVGVGYKVVSGQRTGQLAIIVYVRHKGEVPAEQMVPEQIQGVPTDVVERRFTLHGEEDLANSSN
jgi:hypothetical protein